MRWDELLLQVATLASHDAAVEVRGVHYDSRRVRAGDVFVAMRGGSADGNKFIDAALRQGAAGILTDSPEMYGQLRVRQPELALALVDHGRRALAEASSAVFGRPQDKLKVSAITGTNGKTTTAFLLEQLLTSVGRKCFLIGTIETHIAGEVRPSEHTTPESRDLLALFAEAVQRGCTEVVMEMSSHALDQERVCGIPVDVAIFTNLTQDHLDYHGTMDAYANAKARLFTGVGASAPRVAVVNTDVEYGLTMLRAANGCSTIWSYGVPFYKAETDSWDRHGEPPAFQARHVALSATDTSFELMSPLGRSEVEAGLVGSVNVYNLLAAMAAAMARGLTLEQVVAAAREINAAPGRFQVIENKFDFTVVVDYAHSDDALTNLIRIARSVAEGGRVITMFGCGGDRDKTKRPKMGRAAGAGSDLVVVTSDNPRSEEPMAIINEIVLGVRETNATYIVEEDRRAAIEVAIRAAKRGDIVLLAGKGHEKTQTFADGAVPFDDVAVASEVLRTLRMEGLQ